MKLKSKIKCEKGISLLEIVVALGIFSMLLLSIVNVFLQVTKGQRNVVASQNIQESVRFITEVMSKEIRSAVLSDDSCGTDDPNKNKIFNTLNSDSELYFKNIKGECVKYYEKDGYFMINRAGTIASTTPKKVKISNLKFIVYDDQIDAFHATQGQITFKFDVENNTSEKINKHQTTIQTSISSRIYE